MIRARLTCDLRRPVTRERPIPPRGLHRRSRPRYLGRRRSAHVDLHQRRP